MKEKDYSLLRPFDLEKAKAGEAICEKDGNPLEFVAEGGPDGEHCIKFPTDRMTCAGNLACWDANYIRMHPLCWVEGKPVYKGDVLYYQNAFHVPTSLRGKCFTVGGAGPQDGTVRFIDGDYDDIEFLTWTPPKVKREGWIVVFKEEAMTREGAEALASLYGDRAFTLKVEWEEPAS